MARLRNPRYAPEFLEHRLSPSAGISAGLVPIAVVSTYAGDPPPPPAEPGVPPLDPLDPPIEP